MVYHKSSLNCSSSEEIYREPRTNGNTITCNSKYLFFDNEGKGYLYNEEFEQIITVRDFDFNEVDTFKLPQEKGDVYDFFTAQDDEYFLLETKDENGERMLSIADKSQIGSLNGNTIEYTELCKLDWYKNPDNPYVYTVEE